MGPARQRPITVYPCVTAIVKEIVTGFQLLDTVVDAMSRRAGRTEEKDFGQAFEADFGGDKRVRQKSLIPKRKERLFPAGYKRAALRPGDPWPEKGVALPRPRCRRRRCR